MARTAAVPAAAACGCRRRQKERHPTRAHTNSSSRARFLDLPMLISVGVRAKNRQAAALEKFIPHLLAAFCTRVPGAEDGAAEAQAGP